MKYSFYTSWVYFHPSKSRHDKFIILHSNMIFNVQVASCSYVTLQNFVKNYNKSTIKFESYLISVTALKSKALKE